MRAFYYFLGTGGNREVSWFRPLNEENPFSEVDWSDIVDSQEDNQINAEEFQEETNVVKNNNKDEKDKEKTLESLREAVSIIVDKVEDRFEEDALTYKKAVKTFVKKTHKIVSANDAVFQKALFTFAQEFVTSVRKGEKKSLTELGGLSGC